MKILFIGGSGFISTAVSRLTVAKGIELFWLNRGQRKQEVAGVQHLIADVHKPDEARRVLEGPGVPEFDVVVDWIAFTEADIERDLALFRGRVGQFIFISSASAYQKPPRFPIITESTPLYNPIWKYSQDKIACELRLQRAYRDEGFPITIVRPSLTYDWNFPIAIGGWDSYTLIDRIKTGRPIIVHGDGSSLWVVTHSEDFGRGFVGLFGNEQAIGQAFHITSDEVLTWNQIYEIIAEAAGAQANMIHIASDFIVQTSPGQTGNLLGDKAWSAIFDNSKIKAFVPGFQATIPFREGIRRTLAWFDADDSRRRVDAGVNAEMDQILAAYRDRHG
jgi:nucleoside-diphosphate-sugar epimerase